MLYWQAGSKLRFFRTTPPARCPYLPDQWEVKLVTELTGGDAVNEHDMLSDAGFRRSHQFVYKPLCPSCRACVPVRIPVAQFAANRAQRRVLARNEDLVASVQPAAVNADQYELFAAYLHARHRDGDMVDMNFDDYRSMVEDSPVDTRLVEFRHAGTGRLAAACLIDWLDHGVSAVYSFWQPDRPRRGLGNLAILWLIEETRRRGLDYVYLGYWIEGSRKMAYKSRFRPMEALENGGWRLID